MLMEAEYGADGEYSSQFMGAKDGRPIDEIHPRDEQSGFPSNWHGVIFVSTGGSRMITQANLGLNRTAGRKRTGASIASVLSPPCWLTFRADQRTEEPPLC
jgi:hypothetical protein